MPVVQFRTCRDCGESYRAPSRDTKSLRCRPCRSQSRAEKLRAWSEAHPDTVHRSKRRWHEANRAYVKASKHARRVLERDDPGERFTSPEIFERDGWICQLCGWQIDPAVKFPDNRSASIDHIVPIKLGGRHTRSNVQTACMGCNRAGRRGRMAH